MKGFPGFYNRNMAKPEQRCVTILSWPIAWPPSNGGDKRLVSLIEAFLANKWKVHWMVLARNISAKQQTGCDALKKMGVASVQVRRIGKVDHYLGKLFMLFGNQTFGFPPSFSPLLRNSIYRQLVNTNSSLILTNHVEWSPLVVGQYGRLAVIDCVDICSSNRCQLSEIAPVFPWHGWGLPKPSEPVVDEACFARSSSPGKLNWEMGLLSQFNTILTISSAEAKVIGGWVKQTRLETVPMCVDPVDMDNSYAGPALFVGHNHPFNAQGYAYFMVRVLPMVVRQEPGFTFRVIGKDTVRFPGHPAADIRGFVHDIRTEYQTAAFLLVPVLGGTGQLTRIVEAMAHGLPVVATKAAARSSPIRHGVNGLIAADAAEMARHVVALHRDRELARAMGHAARETVRTECSLGHLRDRIAHIFDQT